tara:strand:+ start:3478 stop:4746 length:1269 start_codon:yes stop_codon:yes gene_type:complete
MANFLGKRVRTEFNGHDVSHLTGVSIGSMGKVFDTYQTLHDAFDHDIEITEEASGSFDFVADDADSGAQKFKEMMQLPFGFMNLDMTTDATTDSIVATDEDFTNPDNQGDYTGTRFMTKYRRVGEGDAFTDFDATNDCVWIRFRAMAETIDSAAFAWKYTGGSAGQSNTILATIYNELNVGVSTAAASSGGSTTTLVDAGVLTQADDSWVGGTLTILSGPNKGAVRTITDSTASATRVTFAALPVAIGSGVSYKIEGVPSDTVLSGAGNLSITVDHNTYNAATKWKVESAPATWTGMTIGDYYWIRVHRSGVTGGGDAQLRIDTGAATTSDDGAYWSRATSTTALGGAAKVENSEAIHYIKFKTTEGLKVVVYDYTDMAETSGVKYTFNKVKLDSVIPSFANRQATRASVSWKCNDWSIDAI